jgi:hypothetical protein
MKRKDYKEVSPEPKDYGDSDYSNDRSPSSWAAAERDDNDLYIWEEVPKEKTPEGPKGGGNDDASDDNDDGDDGGDDSGDPGNDGGDPDNEREEGDLRRGIDHLEGSTLKWRRRKTPSEGVTMINSAMSSTLMG